MTTVFEYLQKPSFLFDSHCHLNAPVYEKDLLNVLNRANDKEIELIFDIAVNIDSAEKSLKLSKEHSTIKSIIGIDPEVFIPGSEFFIGLDADDAWFESSYTKLAELIVANPDYIVGIGETGMDGYHLQRSALDTSTKEKSLLLQERLFRMHLELAKNFKLPLSIHSRFVEAKCLEVIKEFDVSGIFHSFTGGEDVLADVISSGLSVGVNGIITYKNADELRSGYKRLIGRIEKEPSPDFFYTKGIFFETDGPFLSPEGKRGQTNEPANISLIFDLFVKFLKK